MATLENPTVILPRKPQGAFRNEPFIDFSQHDNARAMRGALERVGDELGHEYPLIIGGERVRTNAKIESLNPARPAQIVGVHQKAGAEHADQAVAAALKAFETWRFAPVEVRASLLLGAAELIRERKFDFCAWLTYEVGKNWAEADADVGETIDFLEFYAREALRLAAATPPIQFPGEKDELLYIPLGVGAVISPWNFPFAIMAGMTSAAIVSGNTVVLKPSSDSPTIAARFMEVLEEAGLPPGVVNFCPGSGASFRQRCRGASEDAVHRLHRIEGSRARHSRARGESAAGADLDQADDSRDGRQGLDYRQRRCGFRRCGDGCHRLGFRVQRAEVLCVLARDCRGAGLRRVRRAAAREGPGAEGRRSDREREHGAGGQRRGDEDHRQPTSRSGKRKGGWWQGVMRWRRRKRGTTFSRP